MRTMENLGQNLRDAAVAAVAHVAGRYEGQATIMSGRRVRLDFDSARAVARGRRP